MAHFSKILCFFILLSSFFSCARREQALYQRSPREQFSQRNTQPSFSATPLSLDTSQVIARPDAETIEASVQQNSVANAPSPSWRKKPEVSPSTERMTIAQPTAHRQKARVYKSFLRKSVADGPVQTSGLAVASLVCGILSLFIFSIILGPLAIIFGGVALSKIRRNPEIRGRGLAIAGLIMGIVATVVILIVLASR